MCLRQPTPSANVAIPQCKSALYKSPRVPVFLVGSLPLDFVAIAALVDPVLDASDKPTARPLGVARFAPWFPKLEAFARAAHTMAVSPLEATATASEISRGVFEYFLLQTVLDKMTALDFVPERYVLVIGNIDSIGLAYLGAGGWGQMSSPLHGVLLLFRHLMPLLCLTSIFLFLA